MDQKRIFICVVNKGQAEDILSEMRAFGVNGGLVLHGEGTQQNTVLSFLGLNETKKEVIFLDIPANFDASFHAMLKDRFSMDKKNRGIAFSIPLSMKGTDRFIPENKRFVQDGFEYGCVFLVLDNGKGMDAVISAEKAGVSGATLIDGRGAGVAMEELAFPIEITPEKDIVFMVTPKDKINGLVKVLIKDLDIEKVGQGILFVLPVSEVTGLYYSYKEREA